MNKPLISIITPMYNEEQNVAPFFNVLSKAIKKLPYKFEVLFVDDGSTDASLEEAKKLSHPLHDVRVITLARNFGKEVATTAGINHAEGQAAIIIDSDMQHPVEKIPEFIEKWEAGSDVIIGVRASQGHGNKLKGLGSKLFYKIMSKISDTEIIPHSTDYRLIDRQVVDAFNQFTERERITRGLIDWLGFRRDTVAFEPNEREFGEPSYSFMKLVKLATSSFTAHSLMPLRLAGYLGIIFMFFFGGLGILTYIEMYLINDPLGLAISGTAMLALLLLFAIGIILSSLGLIALYIANIHAEVTNRPLYVVRKDR
jgi:glycosyltransferase involved in cell wall biosynthesis